MQFKVGETIVLCNLDVEVVAMGLITSVGRQGCVHHGVAIKESSFRVQLDEIVVGKSNTLLLVPNENHDPPPMCIKGSNRFKDCMGRFFNAKSCLS
jgi:hypothetical protein